MTGKNNSKIQKFNKKRNKKNKFTTLKSRRDAIIVAVGDNPRYKIADLSAILYRKMDNNAANKLAWLD
jgi:hypothetical protein